MKKYKKEVTNKNGLKFQLNFKPISRRLVVTCLNPPGLSFLYSVEEVMNPLGVEEVEDVLTGVIYKCPSYERFQEIAENVRKS